MSKKTITLITAIIIIVALTASSVWYFRNGTLDQKTFDDFIPFELPGIGGFDSVIGGKKDEPLLQEGITQPTPKLRQISNSSTAGAIVFKSDLNTDNATTTYSYTVRYMDRATGHIYETSVDEISPKRISNTTIPKVYEVFFEEKGESLVLRYLNDNKEIESYYADIIKEENKEEGFLEGLFLQKDIYEISVSFDKNRVFYLSKTKNGVTGIKSDFDGKNKTQIFNFTFTEWLTQWANDKYIYITTKPTQSVEGYMYSLGVKNGTMEKIFGGINGLTTLASNSGDTVLYSESSNSGFLTGVYGVESKGFERISLTTLPEKCVWSNDNITVYCGVPVDFSRGEYPDEWYQGLVSFTDSMWKINTETGAFDFLIDPFEKNDVKIDAIKLFLSEDEKYLFFTNKKDMTLWVLNLE